MNLLSIFRNSFELTNTNGYSTIKKNFIQQQKIEQFNVIGIAVRTAGKQDAGNSITSLWNHFMIDGIADKIPNKIENSIYCVYTEYEKDHTKPYTTILGCKVSGLEIVPEGMIGKIIKESNYTRYIAKGNILQGIVFDEWIKIHNTTLSRTFATDFELYGEKATDPEDAEVDIFVAVK